MATLPALAFLYGSAALIWMSNKIETENLYDLSHGTMGAVFYAAL